MFGRYPPKTLPRFLMRGFFGSMTEVTDLATLLMNTETPRYQNDLKWTVMGSDDMDDGNDEHRKEIGDERSLRHITSHCKLRRLDRDRPGWPGVPDNTQLLQFKAAAMEHDIASCCSLLLLNLPLGSTCCHPSISAWTSPEST